MENPKLYIISTDKVFDYPEEYFKTYFPKRYEKSKEYHREGDTLRSLCAIVLLKEILDITEKDLSYSEYGKPFSNKRKYSFNLSHSGKFCVLAVNTADIGVDIELRRKISIDSAKRVLTSEEYDFLADDLMNKFFDMWTMKESLYKLLGKGIDTKIRKLNVLPLIKTGNMNYNNVELYGKSLEIQNYSISICTNQKFGTVDIEYF